ncbi:MAG: hypothetical protein R2695_12595 [Acidimicrobiales bacterium]
MSSIVSPWRRRINEASMLTAPTSFTNTAIGRSVRASSALRTVVFPAPR